MNKNSVNGIVMLRKNMENIFGIIKPDFLVHPEPDSKYRCVVSYNDKQNTLESKRLGEILELLVMWFHCTKKLVDEEKGVQGLNKVLYSISLEDLYVMAALSGQSGNVVAAVNIGREAYKKMHPDESEVTNAPSNP